MSPQTKTMAKIDLKLMNDVWNLSNDAYARMMVEARKAAEQERSRREVEKSGRTLFRRVFGIPGGK